MNFKKILNESLDSMMNDIKNIKDVNQDQSSNNTDIKTVLQSVAKPDKSGNMLIHLNDIKKVLASTNQSPEAINQLLKDPNSPITPVGNGFYILK